MTPRTGRRPGAGGTRETILEAARAAFASVGYERATIRAIARAADVDPALVHHYFGTKEDLFIAAMELPINPAEAVRAILADGLEGAGERLVRFFLSVWDDPANQPALMSMFRAALTNERAAMAMREFASGAIIGAVAEAVRGRDARLRASLIGSHMLGMAFLRYGGRLEPLASATPDRIVSLLAPRIQSYLTPSPQAGSVLGGTVG
jgi:AcrR family transcriptional regulator